MQSSKYTEYRGVLLQRGSRAYELYEIAKKTIAWKVLDTHMRQLDIEFRKLHYGD